MDRCHAVALILGLVICLVLLGRWAWRPDEPSEASADRRAIIEQPSPNAPSDAEPAGSAKAGSTAASDTTADKDAANSGMFRGRIIDAVTRQPVREFDLEFYPVHRTRDSPKPPFHTFKTKDGRFEAGGLPPGTWAIHATARGYQRFELAAVEISSGKAAREILIPMRPGHTVQGRVFDQSTAAGIAGANISFREAHVGRFEGNFRIRPATLSQQDGAFVLDGLPAGQVVLTAHAENYRARDVDVMVGNKTAPVEIGLSAGSGIAGYLTGADGLTPVAGIVSLINIDESSGTSKRTGSAGEFDFPRLAPGRYQLSARGAGLSAEREIALAINERLEGLVIAMRGGHDIRGVVSGLKPEDLRSTSVSASREGVYGLSVDAMVDERGAYTLQNVTPGRVHVVANARSRGQISKAVEMPADADLTVNLEFPRGARLTGRVTRGGKPLSGVSVNPTFDSVPNKQHVFIYEVRTSASGDYVIEDVPHGEYTLWIESYRSPIVRVSGDTVFDVDIPAVQLAGRLLEEGGKVPVVGANVDIWSAQRGAARIRVSARSDHFGQFALRGLQPGDFVVSVYKPGYELYRGPLAYGSPISDLTIGLRPARGVELKVRDAITGRAMNTVTAMEVIDGAPGIVLQMNLDQNGVGYLPTGIAGSSLRIFAMGYAPMQIAAWNGEGLEVSLQRQAAP